MVGVMIDCVIRVSRLPQPVRWQQMLSHCVVMLSIVSSFVFRLWYLIKNLTKISPSFMHNQTKISF